MAGSGNLVPTPPTARSEDSSRERRTTPSTSVNAKHCPRRALRYEANLNQSIHSKERGQGKLFQAFC